MKNLLIIGGVAAGATAAARARRLNSDVNITILEAGGDVSFANCGLPYFIGGDIANRSSLILASPETFHDQYRITVHTYTEAVYIDRNARTVRARNTQSGEETDYPYDRLILAQGGKPIVPALPGVERDHVFQLWTLNDMDAIDHHIRTSAPAHAVVVGGGFIGLEMVEALVKRGIPVDLVEMSPHVMPAMESEFAGFLTRELRAYSVGVHTNNALHRIDESSVTLADGTRVDADMVLLSVGVKPTLAPAKEAGLVLGDAGGLNVNSRLQTSDENIYAAGDMVEIECRVSGRSIRVPLAGPANRQGRIAAENALGGNREYRGTFGTSVVKLFDAVAGSTGLSLDGARRAGFDADAVVVHKTSHTAYYPGAAPVSLMVVFDRTHGTILGAQAAGYTGVEKRLDVMATAIAGALTLDQLEELDLAYAPPFNSPNGPVNTAAFTANNHRSGFSPAVLARDLERFTIAHEPVAVDLRDPISFAQAHLTGSTNLNQNMLRRTMDQVSRDQTILLISEDGRTGHVALRMLRGAGFERVYNVSGGYTSLERYARAVGYEKLTVGLIPLDRTRVEEMGHTKNTKEHEAPRTEGNGLRGKSGNDQALAGDGPLVIDVRTPEEFSRGAYPGAINISLDDLAERIQHEVAPERNIILYCASGARSAYAVRLLQQIGFTNVENGGGLHDMLSSAPN